MTAWRRVLKFGAVAMVLAAVAPLISYLRFDWAMHASRRQAAESGEPHAIIQRLEPFEARHPRNAELAYLLSVARRRAGLTNRARDDLRRAEELGWPAKDVLLQQQMLSFQAGDVASAEPFLLKFVKSGCPDDQAAEIYECLVKGYLSDMRLHEAELCLDYWLQWRPRSLQALLLRAEILAALMQTDALIALFREIVELAPDNAQIRRQYGYTLLDANDARGALEQFSRWRELAPDDASALVGVAACHRHLGKLDEAEAELAEALEEDVPDAQRAFALTERGQLAMARKQYSEVVEYLRRAVEASPGNDAAHYSLAMALSRLGKTDEANEHLEKSRRLQDRAQRLSDVLQGIMRDPESAALRCEAGEILLEQGRRKDGLMWLVSALRRDHWRAETHRALADYYSSEGDARLAQRHRDWAAESEERAEAPQAADADAAAPLQ